MELLCAIGFTVDADYFFHRGEHVNLSAMLIIVFYFAVIIVPLAVIIRESFREICRLAAVTPEKQDREKSQKASGG